MKMSHCQIMEMFWKLLIFVTFSLPVSTLSLPEFQFPAIFNFGDSNSDTGASVSMFGQDAAPPPNGVTFFGSPSGRACDGRLIIDFIAENLGIPYLNAYLDSMGTNFSHGANFATIGSTIQSQNSTTFLSGFSPITLDVQYAEFERFKHKSQTFHQRGDIFKDMFPEEYKFSSALYTFDIGLNDLGPMVLPSVSTEQVEAYIHDIMAQFATIIKKVYSIGGRAFWIHNTAPFGCTPGIMTFVATGVLTSQLDQYGCAASVNNVSQYFNKILKEAVSKLRKDLHFAAITYVDIYSVKYSLIARSKELGFGDPFLTCCGYGGKYNFDIALDCGMTKTVNGTKIIAKSCEDPSSRISWDGRHYTEAANRWIYSQIVDGAYSDPPVPLKIAFHEKNNLR